MGTQGLDYIPSRDAAKGAKGAKDLERKRAERVLRTFSQLIQVRPGTTDELRAELGLPVPDRTRTRLDPEKILLHPPPLHLVKPGRGQVELHFGPDPEDENSNALPEICRAQGGVPPAASGWVFIAEISHSPHVDVLGNSAPVTVTYRFQYVDRLGRPGSFSDPVTVAVSA